MIEITIPRGTMPAGSLPSPEAWQVRDGMAMQVDSADGDGPLFTRLPDPQVREEAWSLTWSEIPPETAASIRAHYRDHPGEFRWRNPRTGVVDTWRHTQPPTINFQGRAGKASAQVFLARLAAHAT